MNQPHRAREAGGAKSGPSLKTGEQVSKEGVSTGKCLGPWTWDFWTLDLGSVSLNSRQVSLGSREADYTSLGRLVAFPSPEQDVRIGLLEMT